MADSATLETLGLAPDFMPVTRHGIKPGANERKQEQYWHKSAAILFSVGRNCKQVAEAVGKSYTAVTEIHATPWFQEMVTQLIVENGGKDLVDAFKKAAVEAHGLLVDVLSNEKAALSLRVKVATDMVERVYGKATQRIEHGAIQSDDPVAEVERLRRENEQLLAAQAPSLS